MFDTISQDNENVNTNNSEKFDKTEKILEIDQAAITQIRASLSAISNSHSTWNTIADALRGYFDEDQDGSGLKLFRDWIAKNPHADHAELDNPDSKAVGVWFDHAGSDRFKNPLRPRPPDG